MLQTKLFLHWIEYSFSFQLMYNMNMYFSKLISRRCQSNGFRNRINRTKSNAIDRLKFDCRTQSNLNRISKFWVIFDWFDCRSTRFDCHSTGIRLLFDYFRSLPAAFVPLSTAWLGSSGSTTLFVLIFAYLGVIFFAHIRFRGITNQSNLNRTQSNLNRTQSKINRIWKSR